MAQGLRAAQAKAQAEDWETWYQLAAEGKFKEIPAKIQIKHLGNLERIHRQNLKFIDQTDVRGVWIWGAPGVGKSHFARQVLGAEGYYPKLNNKWWDGYQSQKVVIMEDVDKETVSSFTTTSRFGRTAGVHWRDQGGAVAPIHRWLVVTSNYSIMDILKDLEDRQLREAITVGSCGLRCSAATRSRTGTPTRPSPPRLWPPSLNE